MEQKLIDSNTNVKKLFEEAVNKAFDTPDKNAIKDEALQTEPVIDAKKAIARATQESKVSEALKAFKALTASLKALEVFNVLKTSKAFREAVKAFARAKTAETAEIAAEEVKKIADKYVNIYNRYIIESTRSSSYFKIESNVIVAYLAFVRANKPADTEPLSKDYYRADYRDDYHAYKDDYKVYDMAYFAALRASDRASKARHNCLMKALIKAFTFKPNSKKVQKAAVQAQSYVNTFLSALVVNDAVTKRFEVDYAITHFEVIVAKAIEDIAKNNKYKLVNSMREFASLAATAKKDAKEAAKEDATNTKATTF